MKNFFLALYRFLAGKPIVSPPKHHYDQNEGDEGIDDAIHGKEQKPDTEI